MNSGTHSKQFSKKMKTTKHFFTSLMAIASMMFIYHMNWGKDDGNDGWYASNYPSSNNYQYYRQDIFVTSPI